MKKMMKKFVISLLTATLALSAATLAEDTTEGPEEAATIDATIGIAIPDATIPWFSAMRRGFEDQADKYGMTLDIVDAQNDAQTQTNQIETFITKGVDMVIMLPVAADAMIPAARALNEAGIPFITDNRVLLSEGSPSDYGIDMVSYVGASDYEGGKKLGELVVELIGESGKIAVIDGAIGSSGQVLRSSGLADYIEENGLDIDIIAEEDGNWDQNTAITVTQNFLVKFGEGEIDAIVSQDPFGAVGAAQVIADQNREDLMGKIIGYDLPPELYDEISKGTVYGAVVQNPYDQATLGVDVCYQYLTEGGDNIEENVFTDLPLVTINNVAENSPAW